MAQDLLVLSALIRRELGLDFSGHLEQLARKASTRLAATNCADFAEYISYLRDSSDHPREMNELANVVTNNETYFFREQVQLTAICDPIVSELLLERRDTPIKILSVPSSTGEEPYSIAMNLMMSNQPVGTQIEIYGADVSERALAIAREGRYRQVSFRGVAADVITHFFARSDEEFVIDPHVQGLIKFFHANLIEAHTLAFAAPYDIIFCRNVMIYFDRDTQDHVVDALSSVLAPGGYLCFGHADATVGLEDRFDTRTFLGTVLYRRKKSIHLKTVGTW